MSGVKSVAVEVWTDPKNPLIEGKYYEFGDCLYCFEGLSIVRWEGVRLIDVELKRVGEIGGE